MLKFESHGKSGVMVDGVGSGKSGVMVDGVSSGKNGVMVERNAWSRQWKE